MAEESIDEQLTRLQEARSGLEEKIKESQDVLSDIDAKMNLLRERQDARMHRAAIVGKEVRQDRDKRQSEKLIDERKDK